MSNNSANKKVTTSTAVVYRRLFSYMKPYKWRLILAVLLIFLGVASMALAPMFLGLAIEELTPILKGDFNAEFVKPFIIFLILMVAGYLLHSLFCWIGNCIIIKATQETIYDLRKEIDEKINKLPLNYYDTTTYGDILSRVTNDVDTISASLQTSIFEILNAVFTVVLTLVMMIYISGGLTLIGLLTFPVLIIISSKITKKSQKEFDEMTKKTGDLNGFVEEYYSGHNVVAVFGKEDEVEVNFEKENQSLFDASNEGQFLAGCLYPISESLNKLSYVLVTVVGAIVVIVGGVASGLTVGMIQAFTQYLTQFTTPITEVMQITATIQTTGSAATRVFEFIDEQEEVPDAENPKFPAELKGAVDFDHVKFGYLPHQTLIHDLDVKINPGEKTAIVGPTGAGKTTLVNLIMRFYDVKGGAIRIDGVDVRDMKRQDLRKIFGMVLQDTWLYNGTIMENIRYGKLDATDEEVIEAAKKARADSFIRTLPGGYNFVLQEGAANIAQGQRQLLTIARAMLADAPIMILDEATSSVDTRTEVMIQEAMVEMMKGRTSFVIAHRLSTIKDSQKILYMQDGDILEIGNHEELMAKNGLYAKLYNSQFDTAE